MSTAIASTDSYFGPWIIPSRAQNMIMNHYAHSRGMVVDAVIPEPLFSSDLGTTRWSKRSKNLTAVILCSIHQLPQRDQAIEDFVADMQDVEMHFVLENLSGKGEEFLRAMIDEAASFQQAEVIDYHAAKSYQALYQKMKDQ